MTRIENRTPLSGTAQPNIVIIMTDQQRFDSLGCYGADFAHTPRLDRLASEGVRFEHCYVNNPICTPSRASIQAIAVPKNPLPACQRNSRRVRPQGKWKGLEGLFIDS